MGDLEQNLSCKGTAIYTNCAKMLSLSDTSTAYFQKILSKLHLTNVIFKFLAAGFAASICIGCMTEEGIAALV
ncbi:conserved hypothetical protein [Ricinus communis]|uniref:Uncharacterized protein n=1 Tax=Ricinus communis TaxID=3988 RepID=B9S3T5_RICCO|nr:conserved hypothetical protein [Ricinus communis]